MKPGYFVLVLYAALLSIVVAVTFLPRTCSAETYVQKFCNTHHGIEELGGSGCGNWFCMKVASRDISWKSLYRDVVLRDVVMRVNRTNRDISPGMPLIVVEGIINKDPEFYKSCLERINPLGMNPDISLAGHKTIVFDPKEAAWSAYDILGNPMKWGMATGGRGFCKDIDRACRTPVGTFKVLTKKGKHYRSQLYPVGCEGTECTEMPYYVRFRSDGPGFHGSKNIRGFHDSHGCVHLTMDDAKWVHDFVDSDTVIIVRSYK